MLKRLRIQIIQSANQIILRTIRILRHKTVQRRLLSTRATTNRRQRRSVKLITLRKLATQMTTNLRHKRSRLLSIAQRQRHLHEVEKYLEQMLPVALRRTQLYEFIHALRHFSRMYPVAKFRQHFSKFHVSHFPLHVSCSTLHALRRFSTNPSARSETRT